MKIYKYYYYRGKVEVTEIEVEEKPKTYVVCKGETGTYLSRIQKSDINTLRLDLGNTMFSLELNKKNYIEKLLAKQECAVASAKARLKSEEERRDKILSLLEKEE